MDSPTSPPLVSLTPFRQIAGPQRHMSEARTVLLVDDNEDNRFIYTTMLAHHGYRVLEAGSGEDAVRLAGEQRPNLILMDISITGIDGWTATEQIRERPETRAIPVVALTGHSASEHRARAVALDCAGYLTKPCEPSRVLHEVRRLIG